jgi:hypothetical protein
VGAVTAPACLDVEVRPVPGFPVSVSAAGAIYGPKGLRKVTATENRYRYISVRRPGARWSTHLYVHRAVLLAWVGPCPPGQEGRHLNGDRQDNRVENLAWSTHLENIRDKHIHGTMPRGSTHGCAVLSEDDVREIRRLWPATSQAALGLRFGVAKPTVARVVRRETWRHVQ